MHIPIRDAKGETIGSLDPLTVAHLGDAGLIDRFVHWRNQNREGWLDQRPVTVESTQRWLGEVVYNPYRMSFLILWDGRLVGRCGFLNLTPQENEADSLVRGERGGGYFFMRQAQLAGLCWQFEHLGIESVFAKVLSTNERALNSCQLLGYDMQPFADMPLYSQMLPEGVVLSESGTTEHLVTGARLLYLRLWKDRYYEALASLTSTLGA